MTLRLMAVPAAALLATAPAPTLARQVTGPATVIDGDSLSVNGVAIRLFGIDAPEGKQTCERGGVRWACGGEAATQLRSITTGQQVSCEGRGNDVYGRLVAVCTAGGSELNRTMVEAGWATAFRRYSDDYVGAEAKAKTARAGIWSSNFDLPEDWRTAHEHAPRSSPAQRFAAPAAMGLSGCAIKGNRNRKGEWIYHLPGFPYYEVTRAEQMFCSEAEAQAAGYRRAIVR
jgi:endonuclease YncB( thermonuclease family)